MRKYKGSGNAGVSAYEIRSEEIVLEFKDGSVYLYDYIRPGKEDVENLKKLAIAGKGVTTYINQHVRENYKEKLS